MSFIVDELIPPDISSPLFWQQQTTVPNSPVFPIYTAAANAVAAGSSSVVTTFSHSVSKNDALIVAASSNSGTTYATTVTDTQGNYYQLVAQDINRNPNISIFVALGCKPCVGGTDTITVSFAGTATVKEIIVRGCSGIAVINAVDQVKIADAASGSPALGPTQPLVSSGEWALAALVNGTAGGIPSGWTNGFVAANTQGTGPFLTIADQILTNASAISTGATIAGGNWSGILITLSPVMVPQTLTPIQEDMSPPGLDSPATWALFTQPIPSPVPAVPVTNIAGQVANVSVNGQFSDEGLSVTNQIFSPQFPFDPITPNSLQFNNSLIALKVQYPTALPDVFVPGSAANVNVSGQADNSVPQALAGSAGNVNVTAPAGTVQVFQTFAPQFSFPAILPKTIQFNPVFSALRVQFNTALPDVFVPGTTVNVSVSAPAGTVTALIDGVGQVANVNTVAVPGSLSITTSTPPQYPVSPILPVPLKFIPAYLGLRPQYSTALPDIFVPGSTANVNASGQSDNTITETVPGVAANVSVTAVSGNISISISGATGLVNTVAIPGSPGSGAISIAGVTCAVIVTAYPGGFLLTNFFNPNWWRVYRGYGQSPVW